MILPPPPHFSPVVVRTEMSKRHPYFIQKGEWQDPPPFGEYSKIETGESGSTSHRPRLTRKRRDYIQRSYFGVGDGEEDGKGEGEGEEEGEGEGELKGTGEGEEEGEGEGEEEGKGGGERRREREREN